METSTEYIGKNVIISGCQGNLGPLWVKALRAGGATVVGFDYDPDDPISTTNADVRDIALLHEWRDIYYRFGYLVPDIIINNAAIDTPPKEKNITFFTEYKNTIETNLIGAINLTSIFIDDMIYKKSGLIINIGSIQGNVAADIRNYADGFEKPVGYNVSKAGLIQFTRSIAVQYGAHNIRSVCLAFSAVDSGKFEPKFLQKFMNCLPLKKLISYESLAASLRFAVTCPELTGTQVLIDSGYTAW